MKIMNNIHRSDLRLRAFGQTQNKFSQRKTHFLASNGSADSKVNPNNHKPKWSPGQIAQTLGSMKKSISALKAELKHKDPIIRQRAWSKLSNLYSQSIAALRFRHPDASTRIEATRILDKIGWIKALSALADVVHGIRKDPNSGVREAAVYAIGTIRTNKSIDALLTALNDSNSDVREAAVQMLIHFKSFKDKRVVPALIKMISGSGKDPCPLVRREAVHVLKRLGDNQAVPALNSALTDSDIKVKKLAATALGEFGDKKSVKPLTSLLIGKKRDASSEVRGSAAAALGDIGSPKAITLLIKLISGPNRDLNPNVRISALWGLKNTNERRRISALKAALRDPAPSVRKDAAEILREIKNP
jgi:HEAT repeat protein